MTTLQDLRRRREELLQLAARHHAVSVSVFGSVLREEDAPASDIDFLVEFAPEASLFDQVALQQDLEVLLGRRADVVTPGGVSPFLRERILKEALPL